MSNKPYPQYHISPYYLQLTPHPQINFVLQLSKARISGTTVSNSITFEYYLNMARSVEFDQEAAIRKAVEVFKRKGYNGASLRDLTEAMQINSSSLYNTIGDKQELFVRCVQQYTDTRKRDLDQRSSAGGSPLAKLTNYVEDSVTTIISEADSCLAVKTAFEVATEDPRVKNVLKEDSDNQYHFIRSQIEKAIENGEIANEESPELLADYFISTWTGWNESYIIHKDPIKIKRMAAYFIRQLTK